MFNLYKVLKRVPTNIWPIKCSKSSRIMASGEPLPKEHVNLTPHKDFDPKLMGTLWSRTKDLNGNSKLSLVPPKASKEFNTLAIGGIDFDTKLHMAALLKSCETFYRNISSLKCAAIYPNASKSDRYDAASKYNQNALYYPEYIETLTLTHILTRFLRDNGTIDKYSPPSLLLYSFSIGGREIMMIENCLRDVLQTKYNCSNSLIDYLFSSIKAHCIGYALDIDNLPEPRFSKSIVFSTDDRGVMMPASLTYKYLLDENISLCKAFSIPMPATLTQSINLILLGPLAVPDTIASGKVCVDGHSLPHYIEGLKSLPEIYSEMLKNIPRYYVPTSLDVCQHALYNIINIAEYVHPMWFEVAEYVHPMWFEECHTEDLHEYTIEYDLAL